MTLLNLQNMPLEGWIMLSPALLRSVLMLIVGLAGIAGAVMAGLTRSDAFPAGDRMPKVAWVGILLVSSLACLSGRAFIGLIGCVFIGLYFFDVRPHLKNIIGGNYSW
ncbi:DUF2516 family protein [Corynebacterium genitalium ATCC 33030]|uniref:Tat pathway signal sequence domain protein n=1 Tax=Corynebacterium genitalium ATCC 33030 TaxID=585529 RepID=D7WB74_9CORY|nr:MULTISPECIES: DUF2516 family protein [Corynebacterium]EFK55105.1 hypothetical protein HMPREF0291_10363 [Corynebacterium genitalium ATCC 33030]UUA89626.1 DUF2516 family protein [Corynebacterium genitalium ATCC 33030]